MVQANRVRLDQALVERGLVTTRETGRGYILAGRVLVDGAVQDKPGTFVSTDSEITIARPQDEYVSRGGIKLAHALDVFGMDVNGMVAVDIGASTGGFTDCLLKRGARKVYAIDVGRGQLAWTLRQDPRVRVMEKTNARYLTREMFDEIPRIGTVDVSFISLDKIIRPLTGILEPGADLVTLIKPQFEAGRDKVGKKGVVRSAETHAQVIRAVLEQAIGMNYGIMGIDRSPILGPEGNIEFLAHLKVGSPWQTSPGDIEDMARRVVDQAHGLVD